MSIFYQSIISRKNEELTTDHLTGIHNRKFIRERFVERITDYPNACMAVADVDFFKNINDRYGHWAGDKVLKSVARYWKKHFEDGNSFVARYGGDEFIFVCFDSSFEDFKKRVMDIYSNFRKTEILNNGKKVEFSMSIGCACLSELEEKTIERLFELADTRMYISKENRP